MYINDEQHAIDSTVRYAKTKQELDKLLESLISPYLKDGVEILDACCGLGHIMNNLSEINPKVKYYGIDRMQCLIDKGTEMFKDKRNITFEHNDLFKALERFPKYFDISISWKALSWVPDYRLMLSALMEATKKHIFISSLFYDGDIDFNVRVCEYAKKVNADGYNSSYNVYGLSQFKKTAHNLGAKNVEVFDFNIGIDLPKTDPNFMGTYTEQLMDGRRMQISGAVLMLWKVVRIDL